MRFLITGLGGFAAGHLAALLLDRGHEVFGLARGHSGPRQIAWLQKRFPGLREDALVVGDVCDRATVFSAAERFRPDGIFHLAAQSSVSTGEMDAANTFVVNTVGTLQVLAAARSAARACRVLAVSSGECYGRAAGPSPVAEDTPQRPVSIYAVSKAASELLVRQAREAYAADVVCARPFNHTGPGQSPRFVCSDFAHQIIALERGTQSALRTGNLDVWRDFLDVRDVVRGYLDVWERGTPGEVYNISSGEGRRIGDIVEDLFACAGVPPAVDVDPQRLRAADVPVLVGDNARLRALGWTPRIAWRTTLADLLADWRQRLA